MDPVETKRVVRNLPVKLNDHELLEFGRRLAQSSSDIHAEEERQTQVKAELKAKLGAIESERTRLAGIVTGQRENRDVSCDMVIDYSRLIVEVIRLDTKEVIETRRMTEAEQQRKLFEDHKPSEPQQAGGEEASPAQVEQIRKVLMNEHGRDHVAEVTAHAAKEFNLFLSFDDVTKLSEADWALLEKAHRGELVAMEDTSDPAAPTLGKIIERAHIAAERSGDVQCCTDCGARLDFMAAGQVEGFTEAAFVGQGCDRAVDNGPLT